MAKMEHPQSQGARLRRRMCVACRQTDMPGRLLRFRRRPDGAIVSDLAGRRAGRSAWLCPVAGCIEGAARRGAVGRSLSGPQHRVVRGVTAAQLWRLATDALAERLETLRRTGSMSDPKTLELAALQQRLHMAGEVA